MNEINRAAYITALQGLLVAATDAQLNAAQGPAGVHTEALP